MKNKNILTEITRIKELVGIKPKLLYEATVGGFIDDLAEQLLIMIRNVQKKGVNSRTGRIPINPFFSVDSNDLINIMNKLKSASTRGTLTDTEKIILGKIIQYTSKEIVDQIYRKVISTLMKVDPTNPLTEEEVIKTFLVRQEQTGDNLLNILEDSFDDPLSANILEDKITEKIAELKLGPGKFKPEVPFEEFVDPARKEYLKPPPFRVGEVIPKATLKKWYETEGEFFFIQFFRNWYADLFDVWSKENRVSKNMKRAVEYVQAAYIKQQKGDDPSRDLELAITFIIKSRPNPEYKLNDIIDAMVLKNPNLNAKVLQDLMNKETINGSYLAPMIENIDKKTRYQFFARIGDWWKAHTEMIPIVNLLWDSVKNTQTGVSKTILESFIVAGKRAGSFITWKDARGPINYMIDIASQGVKNNRWNKVWSWLILQWGVFPTLFGGLDMLFDNIKNNLEYRKLIFATEACEIVKTIPENIEDENLKRIRTLMKKKCEELSKEKEILEFTEKEDLYKNYLKYLPIDVSAAMGGEKAKQYTIQNALFWTYWDEIGLGFWNVLSYFFPLTGKSKQNEDIENQIKKLFEEKEILNELESLGFDKNKPIEDQLNVIREYISTDPSGGKEVENVFDKPVASEDEVSKEVVESLFPCLTTGGWVIEWKEYVSDPKGSWYAKGPNTDWSTFSQQEGPFKLFVFKNTTTNKIKGYSANEDIEKDGKKGRVLYNPCENDPSKDLFIPY